MTDKIEEILWVQVRGKNSFMLGAIYRSEYTDLLDAEQGESKIEENIRKAAEISDRIIVTGDLNVDMSNANDADTQNLQNIYHSYRSYPRTLKYAIYMVPSPKRLKYTFYIMLTQKRPKYANYVVCTKGGNVLTPLFTKI